VLPPCWEYASSAYSLYPKETPPNRKIVHTDSFPSIYTILSIILGFVNVSGYLRKYRAFKVIFSPGFVLFLPDCFVFFEPLAVVMASYMPIGTVFARRNFS
jgi:hypothetical protein